MINGQEAQEEEEYLDFIHFLSILVFTFVVRMNVHVLLLYFFSKLEFLYNILAENIAKIYRINTT